MHVYLPSLSVFKVVMSVRTGAQTVTVAMGERWRKRHSGKIMTAFLQL